MKRIVSVFLAGGLLGAPLAQAWERGGTGPRGGTWEQGGGAERSGTAVEGPHGGEAVHEQGPYGSHTAVEGPHGETAYSRQSYDWNGTHYARPTVSTTEVTVYQRPYMGYPGFHSYYTYGLAPPLAGFSSLAFLSAGMLIGTYAAEQNKTVYVYIVNQGGTNVKYEVDSTGKVISSQPM